MKNSDVSTLRTLTAISLFCALICVGAYIKIPFAVPVTLQLLFTNTAALTLGKKGSFAVLLYIFMGLVGMPVFSSGSGIFSVFSLSFGFNIGFLLGTLLAGMIAEKRKDTKALIFASAINMFVVYLCGLLYFMLIQNMYFSVPASFTYSLSVCVLPFVIPDVAKCAVSIILTKRLKVFY